MNPNYIELYTYTIFGFINVYTHRTGEIGDRIGDSFSETLGENHVENQILEDQPHDGSMVLPYMLTFTLW